MSRGAGFEKLVGSTKAKPTNEVPGGFVLAAAKQPLQATWPVRA